MGHGTAVQDIGELFPLAVAQLSWSPAAMTLKQPFIAMLVPFDAKQFAQALFEE
jgi:hypothetical protein